MYIACPPYSIVNEGNLFKSRGNIGGVGFMYVNYTKYDI